MKTLAEKRPLKGFVILLLLGVLTAASFWSLEWDLMALTDAESRAKSLERFISFLSAFSKPEHSSEFLGEALELTLDTLSIAVLGVAIASVFAFVLAIGASQRMMVRGSGPVAWLQRAFVECCRVVLDALRGVPDFVWAVMLVAVFGLGPIAGLAAIVLNVTGILGKMYSELWDNVRPARFEALQSMGVGRAKLLFYGLQPLSGRGMISFTLMRTECAVRNASVIGIVGGGGLGSQIEEELRYGEWGRVATLIIAMIVVTALTDIVSNFLRYQLRNDPNHERKGLASPKSQIIRTYMGLLSFAIVIAWCVWYLRERLGRALDDIFDAAQWRMLYSLYRKLLSPDFALGSIASSWKSALIPLAIALIGTLMGVVGAALLAFPASKSLNTGATHFTGERVPLWRGGLRRLQMIIARGLALFARAIPEVTWVLILVAIFRVSILPGVLAIGIHSAGVLGRVFSESIDDHSYRYYERNYLGSRRLTFAYAGVTRSWRDWMTYSFFQFESNVRLGVVLGMIGATGLGFRFKWEWEFWHHEMAATHLITMIALTIIIDRISRALKISRIAT